MRHMQVSIQMLLVLKGFLECPTDELWGTEIMRSTHIAAGSIYPLLKRLQEAGFLRSREEKINPVLAGRPARRYYRLTDEGRTKALEIFKELKIRDPA
jgi:PadR family transcriptional regulator PadR